MEITGESSPVAEAAGQAAADAAAEVIETAVADERITQAEEIASTAADESIAAGDAAAAAAEEAAAASLVSSEAVQTADAAAEISAKTAEVTSEVVYASMQALEELRSKVDNLYALRDKPRLNPLSDEAVRAQAEEPEIVPVKAGKSPAAERKGDGTERARGFHKRKRY